MKNDLTLKDLEEMFGMEQELDIPHRDRWYNKDFDKRELEADVKFKELKYGFKYGDATIERHISDEKKGWVVLGLETSKHRLQIYVTKTGKVRIHDEDGREWLPSNGG